MDINDPKLTAFALNEIDDTERAEVEAAINESPELQREVEAIRAAASELEGALSGEERMALLDEQRDAVLSGAVIDSPSNFKLGSDTAALPDLEESAVEIPAIAMADHMTGPAHRRSSWFGYAVAACLAGAAGIAIGQWSAPQHDGGEPNGVALTGSGEANSQFNTDLHDKSGPYGDVIAEPDHIALETELPEPIIVSTPPAEEQPPHVKLQPKPEAERGPFMVPRGVKSIAKDKPVTASDDPFIGDLAQLTDGDKEATDGSYIILGFDLQWVQVDLEQPQEIYAILFWQFHADPRVFHDVIVQIADDKAFTKNVRTVFNNDRDNSAKLGQGEDLDFFDSNYGKLVPVTGEVAQYVRIYSNGSSADDQNYFTEIEVHGAAPGDIHRQLEGQIAQVEKKIEDVNDENAQVQQLLRNAVELRKTGKYSETLAELDAALVIDPNNLAAQAMKEMVTDTYIYVKFREARRKESLERAKLRLASVDGVNGDLSGYRRDLRAVDGFYHNDFTAGDRLSTALNKPVFVGTPPASSLSTNGRTGEWLRWDYDGDGELDGRMRGRVVRGFGDTPMLGSAFFYDESKSQSGERVRAGERAGGRRDILLRGYQEEDELALAGPHPTDEQKTAGFGIVLESAGKESEVFQAENNKFIAGALVRAESNERFKAVSAQIDGIEAKVDQAVTDGMEDENVLNQLQGQLADARKNRLEILRELTEEERKFQEEEEKRRQAEWQAARDALNNNIGQVEQAIVDVNEHLLFAEGRDRIALELQLRDLIERRAEFHGDLAHLEQRHFNTEDYANTVHNPFLAVKDNPLSTFSIDVDTAAYANMRRFINSGQLPPAGAVRIEEMLNYFPYDYSDAVPKGDEPFGTSIELAACPWDESHRLMRVAIKGKELEDDRPASNLVFLIDVSGSMNDPRKLPLLKESFKLLIDELAATDRVALVVYAGSSGLVLDSTPGDKKQVLAGAIDMLQPGGSTAGAAGIQLAYEIAAKNFIEGGTNRVILATDGDFNVGVSSDDELVTLIEEKRKSGVFLSVLGFGTGNLKDNKMEQLANKGNGNYAYIDTKREAQKVLIEQMAGTLVTIAKDVKLQLEFNPRKVAGYRLIGYENRVLAAEDFNDDTKDAGEIGAGHQVTALYELVLRDEPAVKDETKDLESKVDPLKYQKPAALTDAAAADELGTLKIRYKKPAEDVSTKLEFPVMDVAEAPAGNDGEGDVPVAKTSESFQFASSVAAFGMLLRDSPYKGDVTYDKILAMAGPAVANDKHGYRAEFIALVEKAKQIAGE